MMSRKKNLPMSALITGLLAVPVMGIAPLPSLAKAAETQAQVRSLSFPVAMPPEVDEQIRRIARGEKPSAFGMQGLQRRMALNMQQRLAAASQQKLHFVMEPAPPHPTPMPPPAAPATPPAAGPAPVASHIVEPVGVPVPATNMGSGLQKLQNDPAVAQHLETVDRHTMRASLDKRADGSVVRHTVDDHYDITIERSAAGMDTLTAKDPAGTLLFQGTADDLERTQMPAELKAKLQEAQSNLTAIVMTIGSGVTLESAVHASVPAAPARASSRTVSLTHSDGTHAISVRNDNGNRTMIVKTANGDVVFDGPANTDDDLKNLPADLKTKVVPLLEKAK